MPDSFELSTRYFISDITDEYFINEDMVKKFPDKSPKTYFMFYPIDVTHDVVITSVIFCVGLVLNALNLRCYWSVKTSMAVYIRGMAFIDICVIIYVLLRTFLQYFPSEPALYIISGALGNFAAVVNVLAPLFMALDRILIVAFPHSFKKHENKMRIAKLSWATFQCSFLAVIFIAKFLYGINLDQNITVKVIWSTLFVLQMLLCVALYAVIVCKVRKSGRKIQPDTQTMPQEQ